MNRIRDLIISHMKKSHILPAIIFLFVSTLLPGCKPKTCSEMLGEVVTGSSTQVCLQYEDVDGSLEMGKSRISVDQDGDECDFHLEYQFDGNSDWYVHEVKSDDGEHFERFIDPECKRPQFDRATGSYLEAQSAFYWVMRARDYAKSNLWITPSYWPYGTPSFNKNDLSVNILDTGFDHACEMTPPNAPGCFRPWPNTVGGIKIKLREGVVTPDTIVHEYGHYAAGFVFGHTPNEIIDSNFGWIVECYKRSFNEALAETFLQLFFHSERYAYYDSIGALAHNEPLSSIDLGTSAVWGDSSLACDLPGASDYTEGEPLVQAVHESLWDPVWDDNKLANRTMAQAFSYALLRNSNHFDLELLAEDMLKYINRTAGDNAVKLRINEIFKLHGFEVPFEVLDFDFDAIHDPDNNFFADHGYYSLTCTEDHMLYSNVTLFWPIIKLSRPVPTGVDMTVKIYTEYGVDGPIDDPGIGIFDVRFEPGDDQPSSISVSNDADTINQLLNQDIQRTPTGADMYLVETRGFWLGCTKNCAVRGNGQKSHGPDLKVYLVIDHYSFDDLSKPVQLILPGKSESRHVKCTK